MRIFTTEELEQATNNFDSSREIGRCGYGTVYKGILEDNRVVAIKRPKIMNMVPKDEFVQEMIILFTDQPGECSKASGLLLRSGSSNAGL